jgi:hypothetical protein
MQAFHQAMHVLDGVLSDLQREHGAAGADDAKAKTQPNGNQHPDDGAGTTPTQRLEWLVPFAALGQLGARPALAGAALPGCDDRKLNFGGCLSSRQGGRCRQQCEDLAARCDVFLSVLARRILLCCFLLPAACRLLPLSFSLHARTHTSFSLCLFAVL